MTEEKGLIPYQEIASMAKAFVASGMFEDTKQLSQAIVKVQAGSELGLPPVYSMQNINMIRGRLTTSANTLAMLVKKSGKYDYRITEHDDTKCSIDFFQIVGDKWENVGNSTFTMDDAKRADLVKPNSGWAKYPRAMLFSRAISQGARLYCPDAIGGVYTDEEIRAIPANPKDDSTVKIVDVDTGEIEDITESDIEQAEKDKEMWEPDNPQTAEKSINHSSDAPQSKSSEPVPEKQGNDKPERDPDSIKSINELYKACNEDFGLQPKQVNAELGVNSKTEISETPADCYRQIAAVRE